MSVLLSEFCVQLPEFCVRLRRALPDEIDVAYRIRRDAFMSAQGGTEIWDEEEQRCRHERRFKTQNYRFLEASFIPVGVMAIVVTSECLRLNQFFILRAYQGRGIGRVGMQALVAEADRLDLPVRLDVVRTNYRAIALYTGFGFNKISQTEDKDTMERSRKI